MLIYQFSDSSFKHETNLLIINTGLTVAWKQVCVPAGWIPRLEINQRIRMNLQRKSQEVSANFTFSILSPKIFNLKNVKCMSISFYSVLLSIFVPTRGLFGNWGKRGRGWSYPLLKYSYKPTLVQRLARSFTRNHYTHTHTHADR